MLLCEGIYQTQLQEHTDGDIADIATWSSDDGVALTAKREMQA